MNQDDPLENQSGTESTQPEFQTRRLVLRPFLETDANRTFQLINDPEIAANTRTIPYPYPPALALEWIQKHPAMWVKGEGAVFAICLQQKYAREFERIGAPQQERQPEPDTENSPLLIGAIGLHIDPEHQNAEMGYWIGRAYRKNGFCTEAAAGLLGFAFETLALKRVYASYLARNPVSGRIMAAIGMKQEGMFRKHFRKNGKFEDVIYYGILDSDFRENGG